MNDNDDNKGGYGRPPKKHRFKPGQSGNPRGRPRKPRHALIPSQRRKDVLTVADTVIEIKTPAGFRKMTISEAVPYSIAMNALKGSVRHAKLWLDMEGDATAERKKVYPTIELVEYMQLSPEFVQVEPDKEVVDFINRHLRAMKKRY